MTSERLEEIKQRLERATPGEWECEPPHRRQGKQSLIISGPKERPAFSAFFDSYWEDAVLCAHAPSDLRFLLAERDRLAAEVDRVAGERMSVLSELSKVAFKLGTTEAHLDAALSDRDKYKALWDEHRCDDRGASCG